jgi:sigma-B regulation protein RsbU (phosphoserine phosphatase)
MSTNLDGYFRTQLTTRRKRIGDVLATGFESARLTNLIGEVDAALARLDDGSFGICESCHEPIEQERIVANPLIRLCLEHLSSTEQRELESDLETAARIQRGLLPPSELRVGEWKIATHFSPAGAVSGDYLDVVLPRRGGGESILLLGDVSGKGVSAGFLMAHLRAIFHGLADTDLPAAALVDAAGSLFRESTLAPYIATLVCAKVLGGGELELVNAGHCPPLLVRGGEVEEIAPTGLPLGVATGMPYGSRRLRLSPGDRLVLYSDGLTEALDASGSPYGEERLFAILRRSTQLEPGDAIATILSDLSAFLAGAPRSDDLTLMIVAAGAPGPS